VPILHDFARAVRSRHGDYRLFSKTVARIGAVRLEPEADGRTGKRDERQKRRRRHQQFLHAFIPFEQIFFHG
jgi:hypothetical protein